jgi:DNA-binding NarL/FixJ family response regulator
MLKVVIIDPNAISRNLLGSLLTAGGYDVLGESNTSPAGIINLVKLKPQIVCVGTGDAPNHGMELIESIRTEFPKCLVFVVSASMDATMVQGALQRGVHGFIVKPFNATTVLTTIRNAIIKLAKQQKTTSSE